MAKKNTKGNILNSIGCLLTLVIVVAIFAFVTGWSANRQYEKRVSEENFTEQDTYKMSVYSEENTNKVIEALKNKDAEGLSSMMIGNPDVSELLDYVEWQNMAPDKTKTLGGGSYMSEPDSDGRMDFGEAYWLRIDKKTYVMYVQTVCSRYGKANDGVSAVAVTDWDYYDSIDWSWEWQEDKHTVMAGTPYPGW